MKVLISLSAKEAIAKNSRVAVRQGSDYWLATVTRRSADTVNVQYDEGTKGTATLRSLTHLPDGTKSIKKPLTKEQVAVLKAKAAPVKKEPVKKAKAAPVKKEPVKKAKAEPVKKEPVKKTVITKQTEDDFETKYKAQRDAEVAHIRILDPGNVVEYKGRQYHIADARPMSKRGAGKTALVLKDNDGKLYKFNVPTYNHPLKLVRKASDAEQVSAKKTLDDSIQREHQRAMDQYDKSRGLGITHNSVGDYALIKFTNGTKWMPIQKVDASGRVGIKGSGSKLRWIEARHIQSVSPTTSSDPAVQKAAKSAKDVALSIEREAGLYSPLTQFRDRGDSGDGKIVKRTSISMPYVQRVRDTLEKKGFKFDGKKLYTNADTGVTVEMSNLGDSFSVSIQYGK